MANRYFVSGFRKTIDEKSRIRIPEAMQRVIEAHQGESRGLYMLLGECPGSLSLYPEPVFEEIAARLQAEAMESDESESIEQEFFMQAHHVTGDGQWRFVLPEPLRVRAGLKEEVVLAGCGLRIAVFDPRAYEERDRAMKETWPKWSRYLKRKSAKEDVRA